ncbi:hypothetical protein PENTCL1PPCAC_29961, partial [Pristionchus entomophagus]
SSTTDATTRESSISPTSASERSPTRSLLRTLPMASRFSDGTRWERSTWKPSREMKTPNASKLKKESLP